MIVDSILRLSRRPACIHVIAGISVSAYLFVYVNLPTFYLLGAGHDDGLFMNHASTIAST